MVICNEAGKHDHCDNCLDSKLHEPRKLTTGKAGFCTEEDLETCDVFGPKVKVKCIPTKEQGEVQDD